MGIFKITINKTRILTNNKMKNQEKYFEVGQTVWNIDGRQGVIESDSFSETYPIKVNFIEGVMGTYTFDGRGTEGGRVYLLQTAPILTPNVPIIEFVKGELVEVSDNGVCWFIAFFSHKDIDEGFWSSRYSNFKDGNDYNFLVRKFNYEQRRPNTITGNDWDKLNVKP